MSEVGSDVGDVRMASRHGRQRRDLVCRSGAIDGRAEVDHNRHPSIGAHLEHLGQPRIVEAEAPHRAVQLQHLQAQVVDGLDDHGGGVLLVGMDGGTGDDRNRAVGDGCGGFGTVDVEASGCARPVGVWQRPDGAHALAVQPLQRRLRFDRVGKLGRQVLLEDVTDPPGHRRRQEHVRVRVDEFGHQPVSLVNDVGPGRWPRRWRRHRP